MHVYIYEPFLLSPALKTLLINPTLVTVAVCNFSDKVLLIVICKSMVDKNYIMETIKKYGNNCCRVTIIREDTSNMLFFFQILNKS